MEEKEIERPWHIRQEIKSVFHNKLFMRLAVWILYKTKFHIILVFQLLTDLLVLMCVHLRSATLCYETLNQQGTVYYKNHKVSSNKC